MESSLSPADTFQKRTWSQEGHTSQDPSNRLVNNLFYTPVVYWLSNLLGQSSKAPHLRPASVLPRSSTNTYGAPLVCQALFQVLGEQDKVFPLTELKF